MNSQSEQTPSQHFNASLCSYWLSLCSYPQAWHTELAARSFPIYHIFDPEDTDSMFLRNVGELHTCKSQEIQVFIITTMRTQIQHPFNKAKRKVKYQMGPIILQPENPERRKMNTHCRYCLSETSQRLRHTSSRQPYRK
jgi:hypothetical protein